MRALLILVAFQSSRFHRRDARLWVFGDQHSFEGNSHYLFLWVAHHQTEIEAVWITADPSVADEIMRAGLRAEVSGTPSARRVLQRAGVYIYNSRVGAIGATASNGALLVNLWHGSGLKKIASHNERNVLHDLRTKGRSKGWRAKYAAIRQATRAVFVSTSPAIAARFSEAYDVPLADCPIVGTPRLDGTVDERMRAWSKAFGNYSEFETARNNNREIYVYMPTFREGQRDFLAEALPDPDQLSAVLQARSAVMFLKLHPKDKLRQALLHSDWGGSNGRILPWPGNAIFYNVLHEIDCLVTDYSSVMFDFIATRSAGLLLYPFDMGRYVDERGFYFPYDESVAGQRVDTFADLCDAIATGRALTEIGPSRLARVRKRVWEGSKLPASEAVCDEIRRRAGLSELQEERRVARVSVLPA